MAQLKQTNYPWEWTCPHCGEVHALDVWRPQDNPLQHTRIVPCKACGGDLNPPPEATEVSVDKVLSKGVTPKRRYMRRCYERAWKYTMDHSDVEGLRLVHGTYWGYAPHAWVEIEDVAFDPNFQRFYERTSYYAAIEAVKLIEYTPKEAAQRALEEGGYTQPWPEFGPLMERSFEKSEG